MSTFPKYFIRTCVCSCSGQCCVCQIHGHVSMVTGSMSFCLCAVERLEDKHDAMRKENQELHVKHIEVPTEGGV